MNALLPSYRYLQTIQEDASVVLYRAVREPDQVPVLIKHIKAEYPTLEEIARLKHECAILQSLEIPSVLQLKTLEDAALALLFEGFEGEPLSMLITQDRARFVRSLNLQQFLSIAIQLAETLAQLHQHKIIHKNLKSANVLFDSTTGEVKIIDFSLATRLSQETPAIANPQLLEGTLAYMSPEQTGRMNRTIDYRTDFYSLGVIFYELLTGRLPFQATDLLELVHCHIAKAPTPPGELSPEIPSVLSDIVMKLLAKTAEDRYQSGLGLKADLETCLQIVRSSEKISSFRVGQLDLYSQFLIPQKLYGRESEVEALLTAFDRVTGREARKNSSAPGIEMMLVSGYSGLGKSSLVYEVHKPIVQQRGYFISGKFDQFKRNIPYAAFLQAFQELIRQLLTEQPERIAVWRTKLLEAIAPNGQVIIDVIPEVERIIGAQAPVPQLGSVESQNRFNRVFQQFIHVFCQPEHPLVLFLDDLQWADSASLKLIQLLMSDPDGQYLLLIGAYRDNEVNPTHPLMLMLEELGKTEALIEKIVLKPLHLIHVNQLISETLRCHVEQSYPLAELIYCKTQGNPFFLIQLLKFLHKDGLLFFDFNQGIWQWDIGQLQDIDITDNVVDLMVSQLEKLCPTTQNVLRLAACIGDKFTLDILSIVNEKSPSETAIELWEALQVGLVLPLSQAYKIPLVLNLDEIGKEPEIKGNPLLHFPIPIAYRFLHDRVQQAAYSLIPVHEKQRTHLKIGQLLLEHASKTELEERIFEVVNQLNVGVDLITVQSQRDELASLNLTAGQRAKAATAYEPAVRYLTTGLQLLSATSWETNYDLTLSLHNEATEAEFLTINFERAKRLSDAVLQYAKTVLDTVKVYEVQMQFHAQQNQMQATLDMGLKVLEILGISLSETLIADINPDALSDLPAMSDPARLAAMRILMSLAPAAYVVEPALFAKIPTTMINLCSEDGNSPLAAVAYGFHGMMLCASPAGIESGYRFAQIALKLLEQFNAKELKAQLHVIFNGHIRHWKEHAKATIAPLLEGMQSGLETGALEYAGYNALYFCDHLFFIGEPLEFVAQKQAQHLETMLKLKQDAHSPYLKIWRVFLLKLLDASPEQYQFQGELLNEDERGYLWCISLQQELILALAFMLWLFHLEWLLKRFVPLSLTVLSCIV